MSTASDILKQIKEQDIEWVDLRFTDPKGKWQHHGRRCPDGG